MLHLAHILLVEDNEGDIFLTTDAFSESKWVSKISVVRDGKSALDFLEKLGDYNNVIQPDLVLLDINLPKKNGHEVLKHIKQSAGLKHIPVIMLTTSSSSQDVQQCYHQHANCYITKPVEMEDFSMAIASIEQFWFGTVKLPANKDRLD